MALLLGSAQLRLTCPFPAVAVTPVGAVGGVMIWPLMAKTRTEPVLDQLVNLMRLLLLMLQPVAPVSLSELLKTNLRLLEVCVDLPSLTVRK